MPNKDNLYYYVDIDVREKKIIGWGETNTATLTGDTREASVHRIFLTKGQYHKFANKLLSFSRSEK